MKHPIEEMNINQEEFINELPPEEREYHKQLFRIGNAAYCYHNGAKEFEPTEADFEQWLEGLPDLVKVDMKNKGFKGCRGILSFTRYVNEKNDIGMDQWMKEHLSQQDYAVYKSGKRKNNAS